MPGLAPGFLKQMAEPVWSKPLRVAVSWYLDALNPSTVDTGVVLTQVGLELLVWTQMVHATGKYSKRRFRPIDASDKIALLLSGARVSTAIPTVYAGLSQYAASINRITGPEVFTALRNALVHGSDVERYLGAGWDARVEAWKLGVGYFELAILHIAGYVGHYYNRASIVREGTVYEDVPWTVPASTIGNEG